MSDQPFSQQEWMQNCRDLLGVTHQVGQLGVSTGSRGKFSNAEVLIPDDALVVRVGDARNELDRVEDSLIRTVNRIGMVATSGLCGVNASPEEILRLRGWLRDGRSFQTTRAHQLRNHGFVLALTARPPHVSVFFPVDTVDEVSDQHLEAYANSFGRVEYVQAPD